MKLLPETIARNQGRERKSKPACEKGDCRRCNDRSGHTSQFDNYPVHTLAEDPEQPEFPLQPRKA